MSLRIEGYNGRLIHDRWGGVGVEARLYVAMSGQARMWRYLSSDVAAGAVQWLARGRRDLQRVKDGVSILFTHGNAKLRARAMRQHRGCARARASWAGSGMQRAAYLGLMMLLARG